MKLLKKILLYVALICFTTYLMLTFREKPAVIITGNKVYNEKTVDTLSAQEAKEWVDLMESEGNRRNVYVDTDSVFFTFPADSTIKFYRWRAVGGGKGLVSFTFHTKDSISTIKSITYKK